VGLTKFDRLHLPRWVLVLLLLRRFQAFKTTPAAMLHPGWGFRGPASTQSMPFLLAQLCALLRCACCAHRSLTSALEHFERGLACKYTAADSVKALNKIYMTLLDSSPDHAPGQHNLGCLEGGKVSGGGRGERGRVREMERRSGSAVTHCDTQTQICAGKRMRVRRRIMRACTHHCCRCCGCGPCAGVMERWGAVLARPELQRYAEAATYFETAASKAGSPQQAAAILSRQALCLLPSSASQYNWHMLALACPAICL
jgi:hypothetical protein